MKAKFFDTDRLKPTIEDHLIEDHPKKDLLIEDHLVIYILSLLDPKSMGSAARVSKDWNKFVSLTREYIDLLPTIHRIPLFKDLGLDVIRLKILSGGMTNRNYVIETSSLKEKWKLRVPGKGTASFLSRRDEERNAKQAEELGLNVPRGFFDPEDGLELTLFIEGVQPLDEEALKRKDILATIASLMRTLHSSSLFASDTSIFEPNEELLNALKVKDFNFSGEINFIEEQMEFLKELFSAYEIKLCPCHNDTALLNFMYSCDKSMGVVKEKIYMIDWEYSKNSDFLRDLVYFFVEAKLSNKQALRVLAYYFGKEQVTPSLLAWVEVYKPIVEWWITLWYWTQISNKAEVVDPENYKKNGDLSYNKTITYLQSVEFKNAFNLIKEEAATASFTGARPF